MLYSEDLYQKMKDELKEDIKCDLSNLDEVSIQLPEIAAKWIDYHFEAERTLIKMESKFKVESLRRHNYYSGRSKGDEYDKAPFPIKLSTKGDIDKFVDADGRIRTLKDAIDVQSKFVDWLAEAKKNVQGLQWNIKNAIEYAKFKHGVT